MSRKFNFSRNIKEYIELIFSILCGILLLIGFLFEKFKIDNSINIILYLGSYFFGAYYIFIETFEKLKKKKFEIDFLMIFSALGAAALGKWVEGALLLFLFSLGHSLEHYALHKAKKTISKLGDLLPKTAILKTESKNIKVLVKDLKIKDVIIVNPDSKIPIDGVVIKGNSSVNQAAITGESVPIEKEAYSVIKESIPFSDLDSKYKVFGGTTNEDGILEIRVLKEYKDTILQKMIHLVQDANAKKSKTQILSKKIEKIFIPIVLIFTFLLCFVFLFKEESFTDSFYRAILVLIASSPCALALSTPSAVLSGIARAAKSGVLIKGGKALETLASITTIAFDKTGTITCGKPIVTEIISFKEFDEEKILGLVYNLEGISKHPLSKAVFQEVQKRKLENVKYDLQNKEQIRGVGLKADWLGKKLLFGKQNILIEKSKTLEKLILKYNKEGKTISVLVYDSVCIGLIAFKDLPRATAKDMIEELPKYNIKKVIMLTGDSELVGNEVAEMVNIKNVKGNLLPEDKLLEINKIIKSGEKVAMVGDGVNDAPAMAASHIGIAMGAAGSEAALETSEIALLSDKIEKLPFVIALSQKAKSIITQNLIVSLGVVCILIPLALFEITEIWETVLIHEGSTILVVFNALRLLKFKEF